MDLDLFKFEKIPEAPKIDPVPPGVDRPLFSVMIPVCNRLKFLRQSLESVLNENYPPEQMQICIVDNSTERIDWESFLNPDEIRRIEIFCQQEHVGIAENWNTCIRQARGHLVHILHDDDWILPGFHDEIKKLSEFQSDKVALFATRSVGVDEGGVWLFLSQQLPNHKTGSNCIKDFHFGTPIQCVATVIKRKFYENYGGFLPNLIHTLDWEMWNRATYKTSAIVSSKILAAYRSSEFNSSSLLSRSAENLRDSLRLTEIFRQENKDFPYKEAVEHICNQASTQAQRFLQIGNSEAAQAAEKIVECLKPPAPKGFAWFLYGLSNYLRRQADQIYSKDKFKN